MTSLASPWPTRFSSTVYSSFAAWKVNQVVSERNQIGKLQKYKKNKAKEMINILFKKERILMTEDVTW